MDRSTVVGVVGAIGVVIYAMVSTMGSATEAVAVYGDMASFVLVFIGTVFATMMSMPWSTFKDTFRIVKKTFFHREPELDELVPRLVEYASLARREGKMAMESRLQAEDVDPFLLKAMQMVIDGQDPEEIESALRVELIGLRARHRKGKQLLIVMGKYAPAFGLLTTIVGEIQMFSFVGTGLVNVGKIGAGMAFALIGTLYGVLLANLFCLPLADKLETRSHEELLIKELYIQAAVSMASEASPTALKQNLMAFLDSRTSQRVEAVQAA
ncbi:MAG: MotA/TolQ/ExbB proton channel family protein [Planctomycetes bacterium]|nr:MotA/TolQ/ExbB proton channel family protein [Planctomycetota bacterium]